MINGFRNWFAVNWFPVFLLLLVVAGLSAVFAILDRQNAIKQACFREGMIAIEQNGTYYCVRVDQLVAVDIK